MTHYLKEPNLLLDLLGFLHAVCGAATVATGQGPGGCPNGRGALVRAVVPIGTPSTTRASGAVHALHRGGRGGTEGVARVGAILS